MEDKRFARIESGCSVTINTGNSESIYVTKKMTVDVEFKQPQELMIKSKQIDAVLASMVQREAETMMNKMGRKRCAGESQVGLWEDLESIDRSGL